MKKKNSKEEKRDKIEVMNSEEKANKHKFNH